MSPPCFTDLLSVLQLQGHWLQRLLVLNYISHQSVMWSADQSGSLGAWVEACAATFCWSKYKMFWFSRSICSQPFHALLFMTADSHLNSLFFLWCGVLWPWLHISQHGGRLLSYLLPFGWLNWVNRRKTAKTSMKESHQEKTQNQNKCAITSSL